MECLLVPQLQHIYLSITYALNPGIYASGINMVLVDTLPRLGVACARCTYIYYIFAGLWLRNARLSTWERPSSMSPSKSFAV